MGEAPKNVAERRCGLRRGPWHLEIWIRAGAPSSVAYIEAAATGDLHRMGAARPPRIGRKLVIWKQAGYAT